MDHPLRQCFTDTAALQKTRHHAAGQPVIGSAGHRAHQRIAVGREGKGPIDPIFDADIVQHRVAVERHLQLVGNAVGILLNQFDAVVPGGAVDVPVLVVDLVNTHQNAVLVLAHVGESFEINGHGQFKIHRLDFGNGVGHQVVVLQRRQRQIKPHHAAHLFGPQSAGVDHVFGMYRALFCDHVPAAI